ncbi:sialoadhesin-like [Lineus longissimus]|uniref:sialoadhesin-like n=1 Tax=Lineus longissimus TaxID=88925 RepID=UPI00315D748E
MKASVAPDKPSIADTNDAIVTRASVNTGAVFTFTCKKGASGLEPDALEWYKDNSKLTSGVSGAKFQKAASSSDDGSYTCKASKNGIESSASDTLVLSVNTAPIKPIIMEGGTAKTDLTVNSGASFTLTCTKGTGGSIPDAWKWYNGKRLITTGVTGATFTKLAETGDTGSYTCKAIKSGLESSSSDALALTINTAPIKPIIMEGGTAKTDLTVNSGASFTLTCTKGTGGSIPDAWKWYNGKRLITTGVTGATFTKLAETGDTGSYTCKAIKSGLESLSSDALALTINTAPIKPIIMEGGTAKTDLTVKSGASFTLTCTKGTGGSIPDAWKWYNGKRFITTGVTGATFTKLAEAGDTGSYTCKAIKSGLESLSSDALALTINTAPIKPIIMEGGTAKTDLTVNSGASFTLTCTKGTGGSIPDAWKWYNGKRLITTGVTGATFTKLAEAGDSGSYTCKAIKSGLESLSSDALALTINTAPIKPIIMEGGTAKTDLTVNSGASFTLTCTKGTGGSIPDAWKWYNGKRLITTGVTGATFTKLAETGDTGSYTCKAIKSGLESLSSDALALTINIPPNKPVLFENGVPKAATSVNQGTTFVLKCAKAPGGSIPDSWKWYQDRTLKGVTGNTFTKTAEPGDTGTYKCQALKGDLSSPLSEALTLTVNVAPDKPLIDDTDGIIDTSSNTATVSLGRKFSFSCKKAQSGETPDGWEWYKDGIKFTAGVSGAVFSTAAASDENGSYQCKAMKNGLGSTFSSAVTLKVQCKIDIYGRQYDRLKDKKLAGSSVTRIYLNSRSVLHCVTSCLILHQCDCTAVEYNVSNKACTMVKAAAYSAIQSQTKAPGVDLLILK